MGVPSVLLEVEALFVLEGTDFLLEEVGLIEVELFELEELLLDVPDFPGGVIGTLGGDALLGDLQFPEKVVHDQLLVTFLFLLCRVEQSQE